MILADTSVWIDHLRTGDPALARALEAGEVSMHAFVIGELALGRLSGREPLLRHLAELPAAPVATPGEVLAFVEREHLFGRGIGYVDVHLLAAARLAGDTRLWTRDRALGAVARELGVAY